MRGSASKGGPDDPRGLIHEAYRIPDISEQDCRTIFLDWALGLPEQRELQSVLARLLHQYSGEFPDHPMTRLIAEGMMPVAERRTRRGRGRHHG